MPIFTLHLFIYFIFALYKKQVSCNNDSIHNEGEGDGEEEEMEGGVGGGKEGGQEVKGTSENQNSDEFYKLLNVTSSETVGL